MVEWSRNRSLRLKGLEVLIFSGGLFAKKGGMVFDNSSLELKEIMVSKQTEISKLINKDFCNLHYVLLFCSSPWLKITDFFIKRRPLIRTINIKLIKLKEEQICF